MVVAVEDGAEADEEEQQDVEAVEEADGQIEAIATTTTSSKLVKAMVLAKTTMMSPHRLHRRWENPRSGMK